MARSRWTFNPNRAGPIENPKSKIQNRLELQHLQEAWQNRWPDALAIWSKFTRLSDPRWCFNQDDEKREGLQGSFAMIRLVDQAVVIGLQQVRDKGLEGFAVEILSHEIGHHVYAPGDLTDHGRMIARMRRALPTMENQAPFVANLYSDLLINDRLQRSHGVNIAGVYQALGAEGTSPLWTFYMRIYEILWSLQRGMLATGTIDAPMEGDAQLGARLVRSYAKEWLKGSGRFAMLCLPYLLKEADDETSRRLLGWMDTMGAGSGDAIPGGLTEIDDDELDGAIHPAHDPLLNGLGNREPMAPKGPDEVSRKSSNNGQFREPFEYGAILRALGLNLSDHEIAVRYYRERAIPHLIRYPTKSTPQSQEPLAEGLEPWDAGEALEDLDWLQSVIGSPHVIPGVTTVQRTWGTMEGTLPRSEPIDLDLYVDCSGSMPDPQRTISYLTLAGAIIALSAFRVGAKVQATLWSGTNQFMTTGGFVSHENAVLRILTGYLGGATAFPLHILRDTYQSRKPTERAVHILHISDDGIDTMLSQDERGGSGEEISRMALAHGRGGGSMVLNLWNDVEKSPALMTLQTMGWIIRRVQTWDDLVAFAREFSNAKYGSI